MSHKKLTITEITKYLQIIFDIYKPRAECLAAVVCSAFENESILLKDIAKMIPKEVKTESKTRRLRNFFQEVRLDPKIVALLILTLAKIDPKTPLVLAIDRTEWEKRGKKINLLIISICIGDTAIPLISINLHYKGNSNTDQRIELLEQLFSFFDVLAIKCLIGDREFIGEDWFCWMTTNSIPFVMRLRENFLVDDGRKTLKDFFDHLPNGKFVDLGPRRICAATLHVYGGKTKSGELIILGSRGIHGKTAADMYLRRWNIETGFKQLKTAGFNLEFSCLSGEGKMELLVSILSVAMAWCHTSGVSSESQEPVRVLKHGRKAESIFRRGVEVLYYYFSGKKSIWRFLFCSISAIFLDAVSVVSALSVEPVKKRVFHRCT